ncbi:hypothetical protein EKO27_g3138 [Xylaria grammica]|uniref:Rhodopsin domain-containing protein n=1 Tax=Xylaria grammica TaxID=363999 RepID=A0A439DC31_9PEZI|nr:hypothetical protein EKO27_g3138 [Xylaria grammica]
MALPGSTDLCAIPAAESPDGTYNFVNPESLGSAVVAVGVVLATISTVFGAGRLYVNRNSLHSADYFTLFAVATNIAFTGVICAQNKSFRHQWDTPVCFYGAATFKLSFAQTVLWSPVYFFAKAAILLLYRRLFAIQKSTHIAINFGILITFLVYFSNIPLASVYLAPRVGKSWDSLLITLQSNTVGFSIGGIVQTSIGTLIDLYIFILPIPILFHLNMSAKRRMQLAAVFSTALLGVAGSVVSLVFKVKLLQSADVGWITSIVNIARYLATPLVSPLPPPRSVYAANKTRNISLVETNIAIIVGCMPALAHVTSAGGWGSGFFKSLRSRLLGTLRFSSKSRSREGTTKDGGQDGAPSLVTFGRNQTPRRNNYYELTNNSLLKSQGDTMVGDAAEDHHEAQPNSSTSLHKQ